MKSHYFLVIFGFVLLKKNSKGTSRIGLHTDLYTTEVNKVEKIGFSRKEFHCYSHEWYMNPDQFCLLPTTNLIKA